VRLDFNPKHWEGDNKIMSIFKLIKNPKLSRVDIANDFSGTDFSQFKYTDKRARTSVIYRGRDGKDETYYFGTGDNQTRIYNKGREQVGKGKAESIYGDTWWRVEVQLRDKEIERIYGNPFTDITMTRLDTSDRDLGIKADAMIFYLKHHPEKIHELDYKTRKKYQELILATDEHVEVPLHDFYDKDKVLSEIRSWLHLANNSDLLEPNWEEVNTEGVQDIYAMSCSHVPPIVVYLSPDQEIRSDEHAEITTNECSINASNETVVRRDSRQVGDDNDSVSDDGSTRSNVNSDHAPE
jgi:hypothetical protein